MILRSLMKHVHDQNWLAVALDFFIVVVGVFVGIQVSNWNEGVAEKRLGADYLERLTADLENDLLQMRRLSSYYAAVLESVEETGKLLDQPTSDPQTLVATAYRATEVNYIPPTRATWDQIISSGHLGLIPEDVAVSLNDYFSFDSARDAYDYLGTSSYRVTIRSLIPFEIQKAIRQGCSDLRDDAQLIIGFVKECQLGLDPEVIDKVATLIRGNENVRSTLNYQYSDVYSAASNIEGLKILVEHGLDALGAPVTKVTETDTLAAD